MEHLRFHLWAVFAAGKRAIVRNSVSAAAIGLGVVEKVLGRICIRSGLPVLLANEILSVIQVQRTSMLVATAVMVLAPLPR